MLHYVTSEEERILDWIRTHNKALLLPPDLQWWKSRAINLGHPRVVEAALREKN